MRDAGLVEARVAEDNSSTPVRKPALLKSAVRES